MRATRGLTICLLAVCGWLTVTSPVIAARLPKWARELATLEVPDRYVGEDALVVLDEWTIRVQDGSRSGHRRMLTRVLTEDGAKHAVFTLARGAFDQFSGLRFWVAEGNGKVTRHGEDQGLLLSAASLKILDETEVIVVNPPGLAPGALVAVEYDWSSTPDIPQDVIPVQKAVPVVLARIGLRVDGRWKARARISSADGIRNVNVNDEETWEFRDVPAVLAPEQDGAPEPRRSKVAVDYAPAGGGYRFEDWTATAGWAVDLFDQVRGDREALSAVLEELRGGSGDLVDRVGSMVRRLRYFSIAIGWGGFRPRPPALTLERGFGDCKDKSLLMVTLLRELEVPASEILTSAPDDLHVDPGLSGPRQFNHCVVGVPWDGKDRRPGMAVVDDPEYGPIRIFDPTLPPDSAQDISSRLEGAPGLPVDRRAARLMTFPHAGSGENFREQTVAWYLDAANAANLEVRYILRGAQRGSLEDESGRILSSDKLRRAQYEGLSRAFPGLTDLEIRDPDTPADDDWSFSLTFRHEAPFLEFEELLVLPLMPLRSIETFPLPDEGDGDAHHQPYLVTFRAVDEIVLDGQIVVQLPAAFEVSNDLGRVEVAIEDLPGGIRVSREVQVTSPRIEPDQRAEVMELRTALRRANRTAVVFGPPGIRLVRRASPSKR